VTLSRILAGGFRNSNSGAPVTCWMGAPARRRPEGVPETVTLMGYPSSGEVVPVACRNRGRRPHRLRVLLGFPSVGLAVVPPDGFKPIAGRESSWPASRLR